MSRRMCDVKSVNPLNFALSVARTLLNFTTRAKRDVTFKWKKNNRKPSLLRSQTHALIFHRCI